MKAFFIDGKTSKHIFICDKEEDNPANFLVNFSNYKSVSFPDILTDILNGKYGTDFSEGIILSYPANKTQMVSVHVDSFNVLDNSLNSGLVYVIGSSKDMKTVSLYFLKHIRASWIIKPLSVDENQKKLLTESTGFPETVKERLNIPEADMVLEVIRGSGNGYCIWDVLNDRLFASVNGRRKESGVND